MSYTPPGGDALAFNWTGEAYVSPAGDALAFNFQSQGGLPPVIGGGSVIPAFDFSTLAGTTVFADEYNGFALKISVSAVCEVPPDGAIFGGVVVTPNIVPNVKGAVVVLSTAAEVIVSNAIVLNTLLDRLRPYGGTRGIVGNTLVAALRVDNFSFVIEGIFRRATMVTPHVAVSGKHYAPANVINAAAQWSAPIAASALGGIIVSGAAVISPQLRAAVTLASYGTALVTLPVSAQVQAEQPVCGVVWRSAPLTTSASGAVGAGGAVDLSVIMLKAKAKHSTPTFVASGAAAARLHITPYVQAVTGATGEASVTPGVSVNVIGLRLTSVTGNAALQFPYACFARGQSGALLRRATLYVKHSSPAVYAQ